MKVNEVLVRKPGVEIQSVVKNFKKYGFSSLPNPDVAKKQFEEFLKVLSDEGIKVNLIARSIENRPLSYKVRSHVFTYNKQALICSTPNLHRRGEEVFLKEALKICGVKLKGQVTHPAILDGTSIVMLSEKKVVIGMDGNANVEGVKKFKLTFPELDVIAFKTEVGELNKFINVVGNIVVMSEALAYTSLYYKLKEMEYEIMLATEKETRSMAVNFLPIKDRRVINVPSSINKRLKKAGIDVIEVDLSELVKGNAGVSDLVVLVDYRI
ncbi:MAG: hypothetical protein J7K98_01265 [Candidatus Aenigmarchaeota archaeon]|nr:hypothetical protein [Candidatus Aenigmarchaeota archaeon]